VRRMLLVLAVALVMAVLYAVPVSAQDDPSCAARLANPESGFGFTEPGQAGDVNRTFAEKYQALFGDARSDTAQRDDPCLHFGGEPGAPGAFDPTETP